MKKYISTLLLISIISSSTTSFAKEINFKDVTNKNWYYTPVTSLVDLGYINGYQDNTFKPNENITFAEFLKIIMNASTNSQYLPMPNKHWAYDIYIDAVVKAVIDSSNFKGDKETLDAPLTRENMAYILIGVDENIYKTRANTLKVNGIKDISEASDITIDSIYAAYNRGYLEGKDGYFRPNDNLTRAEASQVIYKFLKIKNKLK